MIIRNYSTFKWIEKDAIKKIKYLNNSRYIDEIIFCADLDNDPSDFSLNGIYFKSSEFFYPIAAGFDIGCGFNVTHTNIGYKELINEFDINYINKWSFKKYSIDNDNDESLLPSCIKLGYLSLGNHFVEFRKVNKINDILLASRLGIRENDIFIIIHNGINENLKEVFQKYIIMFKNKFCNNIDEDEDNGYVIQAPIKDELSIKFFKDVNKARNIAKINREYIRDQLILKLKKNSCYSFDVEHEFLKKVKNSVEHYKGAQTFYKYEDKFIAYVAVSEKYNDYIVCSTLEKKCINHGVCFKENKPKDKSFIRRLFNSNLPYEPIIELSPVISIKNGAVTKWI